MTKPLVTVGALTLVEESRIQFADPVSRHSPKLKGMHVGIEKPDASGKASLQLVPAQREMTVKDLLGGRSGPPISDGTCNTGHDSPRNE